MFDTRNGSFWIFKVVLDLFITILSQFHMKCTVKELFRSISRNPELQIVCLDFEKLMLFCFTHFIIRNDEIGVVGINFLKEHIWWRLGMWLAKFLHCFSATLNLFSLLFFSLYLFTQVYIASFLCLVFFHFEIFFVFKFCT